MEGVGKRERVIKDGKKGNGRNREGEKMNKMREIKKGDGRIVKTRGRKGEEREGERMGCVGVT